MTDFCAITDAGVDRVMTTHHVDGDDTSPVQIISNARVAQLLAVEALVVFLLALLTHEVQPD